MSTLRGNKGHLPSHSGDFKDPRGLRKGNGFRAGIELRNKYYGDDGSKSLFTRLRVHLAHGRGRHRTWTALCLLVLILLYYRPWIQHSSTQINRPHPVPELTQTSSRTYAKTEKPKYDLKPHTYRPDGLLEVNPNGSHPIFDLMRRAETAWNAKIRRASATLQEAVEEYVRRYKRRPPVGFDKWWEYVQENGIQLPDEYDSVMERLEPFWAIAPLDLRRIETEWENNSDVPVMVFGKVDGKPLKILRNGMPENEREQSAIHLWGRLKVMLDIEDMLPDFRAVISMGDGPNLLLDWELREEALEAVRQGKHIDPEAPPPIKHGWNAACPPGAPIHKLKINFYSPVSVETLLPKKKVFIHDHRAAMDPCYHPEHLFLEGQFISHYEGPSPHRVLIPQFSSSSTTMHYDILPIPPRGWGDEELQAEIPWDQKYDERLLWRGANTGMLYHVGNHWQQSQRVRLVGLANNVEDDVTVLRPPRTGEDLVQVGEGEKWQRARVNPAMFDVGFSGSPIQCDESSHAELIRDFDWRRRMTVRESDRYKYVIDVDGNGWSSRFRRLMGSNSVVFKSTVYPEWFADRIQPWLHYIPISLDYSDLHDAFTFFRGDIAGEGSHDDLAKKIAQAARKWRYSFWREEDETAYMFRLFLEYGRLMSLDRESLTMKVDI